MNINSKNFITTKTGEELPINLGESIAEYVNSRYTSFSTSRKNIEDVWMEAWSLYVGSPQAVSYQRQQVINSVGITNIDWRHRLNTGKAFEVVETVHGYLMGALFPNNDWFNLIPATSGYAQLARIVRKYMSNKLWEAKFTTHFNTFLRQLLITGTSILALPWRYEARPHKKNVKVEYPNEEKWTVVEETRVIQNRPDFETLDIFDCYIDPISPAPNEGDFIRRIVKSRAEVIQCIQQGYYSDITPYDICCLSPYGDIDPQTRKDTLKRFQGVDTPHEYSFHDNIEVIEFWGDIHVDGISYHDVCATVIGDTLVRFEPNPYWGGKPFVIGSCFETRHTPYSIGVLQPSLGLIHQLNSITNQRLDNLELAVDEMWTLKQDSVIRPEDVWTEPGKVFLVEDHNDLMPIQRGGRDFVVSYQEASVLEQSIDKNSGTGNLISANAARSGERVTAAEIQAVRDAGGNRLSNLHKHIEATSLIEILKRVYRSLQQFVKEPEIVRVSGMKPGEFNYFKVGANQLAYDFTLRPIGADHVTDSTKYLKDRMDFIQLVSQIPQMAQRIDFDNLLYDIVQHFGFDDPDSYIKVQEQPQTPEMTDPSQMSQQPSAPTSIEEQLAQIGGEPLKQAYLANMAADGGQSFLQNTYGIDTSQLNNNEQPINPGQPITY
ncbi:MULTISPECIES: portal protein [Calothrix]|uniref:Portal protein n=2 Tax=Calothrix TaxID=1186 RepID=A0ABR8AN93_9CYAN|nr:MULTISPECIES: portal protein [Calothrix]MBD2200156.1 hypothetical protein [Calothrix parietina FACHB-288]MBD2229134.1 hypothetical protein [Calothrix anomala FACHB-343]